jgi:flagellar hook-associated protein 1 FlgK
LTVYASSSVAWLQEERKTVGDNAEYSQTLLERSTEALSKETGVNIDEEMTTLLELERSYQASSRLITSIDNMLRTLLAVAG